MTFKRGYDEFSAKPLVPASEAAVIEAQATADAALAASPAPDGSPPATNPTISVRPGIGSLFVVWEPITNADPVTYDVYAVPAADIGRLAYPPLTTDRVGEADGTAAAFRALPDGTDLTPTESYAVAVYARDADGQCTTNATPVIASPAQVTSEDLALNALTVGHLTGNDALFIALQAEDIVGVNITGSTITGTEIKTADTGNFWRLGSDGALARIEAVHDFTTGPVQRTAGIDNVAQESSTVQVLGTQVGAGGIVSWATVMGGFTTLVQRTRALVSDPWGPQIFKTAVDGHEVAITGRPAETGDATPSKVTIDAKNNEGAVEIYGEHIRLSNYIYDGNDSMSLYAGSLLLSGAYGVTITGPAVTIDGVPYSGAAAVGKSARLRKTAAQSTTNSAWTILTFDSSAATPYVAPTSWFTNVAGTYTCVTPGFYTLSPAVLFTSGTAGTRRIISIVQNGIRVIRNDISAKATAAAAAGVSVTDSLYFASGDTFRIEVYQDSGAALNTTSADGSDHATLSITRTA